MIGLALSGGCKEPPDAVERVAAPVHRNDESATELKTEAYHEALIAALGPAREALASADPLAAYQAGVGSASSPPLRPSERRALLRTADPAREALDELDESYLPAAEVVILRALRFAYGRLNDDLRRQPLTARDPNVGLHAVAANLAELRYRLVHDDCDEACAELPAALADDVTSLSTTLSAASLASLTHARDAARDLADDARSLAARPVSADRAPLGEGLGTLATALDEHASWLARAAEAIAKLDGPTLAWTDDHSGARTGGGSDDPSKLGRLPDLVGRSATIRRLSVEERIDLDPGPAYAEVERQIRRWQSMRANLVGDALADAPEPTPRPVDLPRCEAALAALRTGLDAVEDIAAPELDCARYLALVDTAVRTDAELFVELVDLGVIEPQRRALRADELPELALIAGTWSPAVHRHLRRVMILAQLDQPAATAWALDRGRRSLCWAAANLWIHAQLGPISEVHLSLGGPCQDLGEPDEISARVLGDPRGTLAGFGLSLIGDEPARMVGFDRFFWAPLGLMKVLATPRGMHPDNYTLPDDPEPAPPTPVEVEVEQL